MAFDPSHAVLAVDGGGTSCRVALEAEGRRIVHHLGPANVFTDFDGAIRTILAGRDACAADLGLAPAVLHGVPAFVGLAGVLGADDAARVRAALPFAALHVANDRPAALQGALGGGDGALAALGTGSFFALCRAGRATFSGGWGARLGDHASGAWIAQRALAHALDAADGLRPETDLVRALFARIGPRPADVVAFADAASPAALAALAPLVLEAARAGDQVATSVLGDGGREIAARLAAMGWAPQLPLCLIGGVADAYPPYLPADIRAVLAPPAGSALDGALALAHALRRGEAA